MDFVGGSGGERGVDGRKEALQVSVAVSVSGRSRVSAGSVAVRVSMGTVRARLTESDG